jgi:hypothetical protein
MNVPVQRQFPEPPLTTPAYFPAQTLSDTTRQLCCAPYVDTTFANTVIREVIEEERRAVPPSYGFDLDPVVRHCLRARRVLLGRHSVMTVLLLIGLCITPFWTLAWLTLCGMALTARSRHFRHLPLDIKLRVYTVLGVAVVLLCCTGIWMGQLVAFIAQLGQNGNGTDFGTGTGSGTGVTSDFQRFVSGLIIGGTSNLYQVLPLLLGVATFLTLFLFRRHGYHILVSELAPGGSARAPGVSNPRVEQRLGIVAATQRGNITVQERDPFLGSGDVHHGWSFAISLRPAAPTGLGQGRDGDGGPSTERVRIDGASLNQRVREAVLGLRDPNLPETERIPGIFVTPHVVADGVRGLQDPLINPQTRVPHTLASDAAIRAIVGCPQGGLRHYERVVIPTSGKAIFTLDGQPIVPAQDLGIGVTAFVHFAVEGGMLYAEFMATVLPPVQRRYTLVDALRPERVAGRAFNDTLRLFALDTVASPWWLAQTVWRMANLGRRMSKAAQASEEYRAYDYGAKLSVRELAAEPVVVKFLQTLDGWKYIKLLDKVVGETIIDFLVEHGIDAAEFRSAVIHVRNDYGSVTNISGGIQNFGGTNVNQQTNANGANRSATGTSATKTTNRSGDGG